MNSDMIAQNFANSDETLYGAHYVTMMSDKVTYEHNSAEFVMKNNTPNAPMKPFKKTLPKQSTQNVINDDELGVSRVTTSNYLTLTVPKYFFYIISLNPLKRKEYMKGTRFVAINAGGSVGKPCIVGVEE